ncbi:MAG TPA: hypothetical protein VLL05_08350, partial [Terriglobales bacterium]|nr:hypothetical protein [Terriglobales bacterium]
MTIALFAASTVSTHAQTIWTGTVSSDWFTAGNWTAGVPTNVTTANINTTTPNPTEIIVAGAIANSVQVGGGQLTIQAGGTLTDGNGFLGFGGGVSQSTATVSGANSLWANGLFLVGFTSPGTLRVENGGTANSR